jgi:hypothetical protein
MDDHAHARRTDPDTSHDAAAAVSPDLRALQMRVEAFALRAGPHGFTDAEMEANLGDSGSTLRTRRSELSARNIVLDSGQRRTFGDSARRRIVWVHRSFVPDAPPICEPPRTLSKDERGQAGAYAARLDQLANQMGNEGRVAIEREFRSIAEFLRGLR